MGRKKRERLELRFYETPRAEGVLALYGDEWRRVYGEGITTLHFHNLMEVGVCIEGEGTLILDEREIAFHPGMLTVIPHNYPHTTNSKEGTLSYWEYIFFEPEYVMQELYPGNQALRMQMQQRINYNAFAMERETAGEMWNVVRTIFDLQREKKEFYRECTRAQLATLTHLIARLSPKQSAAELKKVDVNGEQILPALYYIERQYMYPIKIEELAKICNMSETNFRRVFGTTTNMKPVDYINMVRVQNACKMMQNSYDSMKDIAVKTGFGTVSTFNRDFKKILGTSPYQWKKHPENYEDKLSNYQISALKGW